MVFEAFRKVVSSMPLKQSKVESDDLFSSDYY